MRHLGKGVAALAVVCVALASLGCNKGPADAAIRSAEQALEAARPEIEKYTPTAYAPLTADLANAKTLFDQGRYTDALKSAQDLATNIETAVAAANEQKAELSVAWARVSARLPKIVEALTARVGDVAATKMPVETAKSELGAITEAWRVASDAFQGGDEARALALARDVEAKAERLAATLGLDTALIAPAGADPLM